MKIALVHDDLIQFGGGERLLLALCEMFPHAPIYTSIYDKKLAIRQKFFSNLQIRTSFMQKLPFTTKLRRIYFPLYPLAFESFDLSEFDIVISSSTRFAHGVITKPKTIHICYLNSPPRFLWDRKTYLKYERFGQIAQLLLQPLFSYLRLWDKTVAASRVDYFIANSKNVAKKIKKIYARSSEVVYPFVDTDKFKPDNNQPTENAKRDYYLVVTRLLPWKQVNVAISAANELKFALKIVGLGPDLKRLKKLAGKTVEFLGEVDDETLVKVYQNAKTTIITQEEDFGLVAVESQACGTPVIAYKAGGNLETVIEGETGLFFSPQNAEALKNVIISFRQKEFDYQKICANANNFSKENFKSQLMAVVNKAWQQKNQI